MLAVDDFHELSFGFGPLLPVEVYFAQVAGGRTAGGSPQIVGPVLFFGRQVCFGKLQVLNHQIIDIGRRSARGCSIDALGRLSDQGHVAPLIHQVKVEGSPQESGFSHNSIFEGLRPSQSPGPA